MPETITVQSAKTGRKYEITLQNPYTDADGPMVDAEIARLDGELASPQGALLGAGSGLRGPIGPESGLAPMNPFGPGVKIQGGANLGAVLGARPGVKSPKATKPLLPGDDLATQYLGGLRPQKPKPGPTPVMSIKELVEKKQQEQLVQIIAAGLTAGRQVQDQMELSRAIDAGQAERENALYKTDSGRTELGLGSGPGDESQIRVEQTDRARASLDPYKSTVEKVGKPLQKMTGAMMGSLLGEGFDEPKIQEALGTWMGVPDSPEGLVMNLAGAGVGSLAIKGIGMAVRKLMPGKGVFEAALEKIEPNRVGGIIKEITDEAPGAKFVGMSEKGAPMFEIPENEIARLMNPIKGKTVANPTGVADTAKRRSAKPTAKPAALATKTAPAPKTPPAKGEAGKEPWEMTREEWQGRKGTWYHGSPTGRLGDDEVHVGTHRAATEALEARIGIPADGGGWTGKTRYGETLLAGSDSIKSGKYGQYRATGFNTKLPKEDFYLKDHPELIAKFGDGSVVPLDSRPDVFAVDVVGEMTNTPHKPMSDIKANATIRAMKKRGVARRGYYYENIGEDAGSVSAVVPSRSHLRTRKDTVESALKDGKPVPAEVLADYPDLAAKYGTPKPPVKGEAPKTATRRRGKQLGASPLGIRPETIVRVAGAAKKKLIEGGQSTADTLGDATAGALGNLNNRLNRYGEAGKEIATSIEKIQIDAAGRTARLFNSIKDAAGEGGFGRLGGLSLNSKTLNQIPGKVRAGLALTPGESKVWGAWVKANDELIKSGIPVRRLPSVDSFPELVGERADFLLPSGGIETGTITAVEKGKITISVPSKVPGKRAVKHTVLDDTPFWTRQMVDPGTFWPKVLKPEILKALSRPSSSVRKDALQHLVDSGQAADLVAASKALNDELAAKTKLEMGGGVRLESPRGGLQWKEDWYDDDFLSVAEKHIAQSSRRIAIAKHHGTRGELLGRMLTQGDVFDPDGTLAKSAIDAGNADKIRAEIERVLGIGPQDKLDRAANKALALEGSFNAVRLLTAPGTAIIQLAQASTGASILGGGVTGKAMLSMAKDLASGSKFLKELRDSGVIEQDIQAILGIDDGIFKKGTDVLLAPMKATDRSLRVLFAKAGIVAVEDAIKNVGKSNKSYRFLKEWGKFSDDDIAQMYATGKMTSDQRRQAMSAGVSTQVRTRLSDIPGWATTPYGRFMMRLQTYSYGQAQIVGWGLKEALRGNPAPLVKMIAIAGPIAGLGAMTAKAGVSTLVGDDLAWSDIEQRVDRAIAAIESGDAEQMLTEAVDLWYAGMLESGVLGTYEKPLKIKYVADKYYKGSPNAIGRVAAQQFLPPTAGLVTDIAVSLAEESKSQEDFFTKLKRAGITVSRKDVPVLRLLFGRVVKTKSKKPEEPKGMNLPSTAGIKMNLPGN